MDSAGREHEGTISRNDSYSSKLAPQDSSAGHMNSQQQLTEKLRDCDWEQLEEKYAKAMEEHGKSEEELRAQVAKLLEIFVAWSQTTVLRDEDRALKRFKTQMQHVQNSEERLENKRKHYTDVVKAFESALALLNGRARP
ncbi:uncharacterized protein ACHE_60717A [Aspergillus chevalieri]|uniref:Uncharacterized protein n=1 Tax=Aspergillus chevalieri TaxID=182096 RepID=A0A7R7ZRK2_ASPCH|nr:uncharacterized protein ACHE_60717A [Aspergillus chevalieri]BCR90831.1 hypothetical protein ACHE_60717A [Aspergillus chevalieri]